MKDLIIGLAASVVAGALLIKNCKPCSQLVDEVTGMVESRMKQMSKGKGESRSDCECGSDCSCGG